MIKEDHLPFEVMPAAYGTESLAEAYDNLHALHESAFYDPIVNRYVIWRYDDVERALSHKTQGISNKNTLDPMMSYGTLAKRPQNWQHMARLLWETTPVTANAQGEKHDRIRKNLQVRDHGASLRFADAHDNYDQLITEEVEQTMAGFKTEMAREGMVAFDETFARTLASRVVSRSIGFGAHSRQRIRYWSDAQTKLLGQYLWPSEQTEALKGLADLSVACNGLVKRKRRTADGSGIAGMLANPQNNISIREAGSALMNLVAAGYSTTSGTLSSAVERLLVTDRDYWQSFPNLDDRTRKSLVNELTRLETGLTAWKRTTTQEFTLTDGRTVIPKGAGIIALIGAANQDPSKFSNPAQIDLDRHAPGRKEAKPLTFGHGVHLCVGKRLAEMQVETSLAVLRDEMPHLTIDPATKVYDKDYLFRTPRYLLAEAHS